MYINGIAHYLPTTKLPNDHFLQTCGVSNEWIEERTGIKERRIASAEENAHTMASKAVDQLLANLNENNPNFDLIIGATYTPYDSVVTLAHSIQNKLNIYGVPTLTLSTACSSLLNAIEVAEGYFASGKCKRAIVVASEHNTAYFDDKDKTTGPLWGDGAVALSISKDKINENDLSILEIVTGGAATVGSALNSVHLHPKKGISMPNGRDVFINACEHMTNVSRKLLKNAKLEVADLAYFIPHQANLRISQNVAQQLNLPSEKLVSNIQYYGNTGCAGFGIGLSETQKHFRKDDYILVSVFGGGYSFGGMLIKA